MASGLSSREVKPELRIEIEMISGKCIECGLCVSECRFLQKYGTPKGIADAYDPEDKHYLAMPFECSLCQLCTAVCPVNINPGEMLLAMRQETAARGWGDYPEHSVILGYERRGTSRRYSYYTFPAGCDTIFFPGCTLPGTRPGRVTRIYDYLKKDIPALGIVLDCCTKPSHDLGLERHISTMFGEMRDFLVGNGIRKVLVACPNCYKVFKKFGQGLSVRTVYEVMAENGTPDTGKVSGTVTIHDPCPLRFENSVHSAVRELASRQGLTIEEMPHNRTTTLCCGEGGAVGFLSPELSKNWTALRKKEADGRPILTYCAGCANLLGAVTPTHHILDLLFEPEETLAGNAKVSRAPLTYFNRLNLKSRLKDTVKGAVTRERTFTSREESKKGRDVTIPEIRSVLYRKIMALAFLLLFAAGAFIVVRHYFYILDSYYYTSEFHYLFITNNLKEGNLEKFVDYFSSMKTGRQAGAMVFLSHLTQNVMLPFSKQILFGATAGAFGIVKGTLLSYASLFLVGLLTFGIGMFFLAEVLPFLTEKKVLNCKAWANSTVVRLFPAIVAVPWVPVSAVAILAALFRLPFRRYTLFMAVGLVIRTLWLLIMPGFFV